MTSSNDNVQILWKSAVFCGNLCLQIRWRQNHIFSEKLNILLKKMSSFLHPERLFYTVLTLCLSLNFLNYLGREALGTLNCCLLSLCSFVFLWRALGRISVSPNAIKHSHVLYFTAITVGSCFIQPFSDHKPSFYVGIRDHR